MVDRRWGWDLGVAMYTAYGPNGYLGVQIDGIGGEDAGLPEDQLHHAFGFASRPRDPVTSPDSPTTKIGCTTLYAWEGSELHAWLGQDPRYQPGVVLPQLGKGGSIQYCAPGGFAMFDGEDGTWMLYAPASFDADGIPDSAHTITVGVDPSGDPILSLVHSEGMRIDMANDKIVLYAGGTWLEVGEGGVVSAGKTSNGSAGGPLVKYTEMMAALTPTLVALSAALAAIAADPTLITPAQKATVATAGTYCATLTGLLAAAATLSTTGT